MAAFSIVIVSLIATSLAGMVANDELKLHGVTDKLDAADEAYMPVLKTAFEAFATAEELFESEDFKSKNGWFKDATGDEGDIVYGKITPEGNKMVTVKTVLDGSVDSVMHETWTGAEGIAKWNPNIDYSKIVKNLTDHIDILTYGNNDLFVISGRQFLSVRIYRKIADHYIMASRSIDLADFKPMKGKVRANLHLAAVCFRPHPDDPEKTTTEVVMHVDLKGMIPKIVANSQMGKIMLLDTSNNRKHFAEVAAKETVSKSN